MNTLILLESLVKRRFSQNGLQGPGLIKVVKEIPALINEIDIQLSQIAITFITSFDFFLFCITFLDIVNSYPDQIHSEELNNLFTYFLFKIYFNYLNRSIISLVQSSLLQGTTLNASLGLIAALIRAPLPNKPSFEVYIYFLNNYIYIFRKLFQN